MHVQELSFGRQTMMNIRINEKKPAEFVFISLESGNMPH